MRRLAAAVMLLLVAAAGQGFAASSSSVVPPTVSPEDARAGCLHTDLRRCMISLGSAFWFQMSVVAAQIARRNEPDVNGNTAPSTRRIGMQARLPGETMMFGLTLTLASPAPNDEVVKIALELPLDPELAHTASEYDRTLLYDVVSVVLGSRCPSLDRLALYRFFENTIKPKEVVKTDIRKYGIFHFTKQTVDTERLPFCGALFSVHRRDEFDGTPDMPNRKPSGVSIIDIE